MKEFTNICDKNRSDKGSIQFPMHRFSEVYDDYFNEYKNTAKSILEIGVCGGASVRSLYDYFTEAKIYGLDIGNKTHLNNDRITCDILDQSDEQQLQKFCDKNLKFDIIIDDGSHHMKDQQITFGYLFPLLNPGGLFIIEDLHTSLCNNGENMYGKPLEINSDRSNTTLSYLNSLPNGKSVYLSEEQNNYIQKNINFVKVYLNENQYSGSQIFDNKSITSIIKKK